MLPSVKFAEDKVLTFLIFRVKNAKIVYSESNLNLNPNFKNRLIG